MKIGIVKYNAGNICSVQNALRRLGVEAVVSDNAEVLQSAERVIFPGVGEASSAMRYLRARKLDAVIKSLRQPVLGVCLGMQLLGEFSDENETECLGVAPFRTSKFISASYKVPHVGWNQINNLRGELFDGVAENDFVYFVHGFYVKPNAATVATCDYIEPFSAAIKHKNFYAVQFHTEKSGAVGARILENFLKVEN